MIRYCSPSQATFLRSGYDEEERLTPPVTFFFSLVPLLPRRSSEMSQRLSEKCSQHLRRVALLSGTNFPRLPPNVGATASFSLENGKFRLTLDFGVVDAFVDGPGKFAFARTG